MGDFRLDFFVAGVQKGGTTALYSKLKHHPDIFLPERKELHFFDKEHLDWQTPDYDILHEHFHAADGRVCGKVTPMYIYYREAIERICAYNPDAKIICILRHPAYRALSQWKMEVTRGAERFGFHSAIARNGVLRVVRPGRQRRVVSYLDRGHYATQIERLFHFFPKSQTFFMTTDQLWTDENDSLRSICSFLGVSPSRLPTETAAKKYIAPVNTEKVHAPRGALSVLKRYYRNDIKACADLTGLNLDHWLRQDYTEPMVA